MNRIEKWRSVLSDTSWILLYTCLVVLPVVVSFSCLSLQEERLQEKGTQESCWFLAERARGILVSDLSSWLEHVEHCTWECTVVDYYDIRVPEMQEFCGVTGVEALDCLHMLRTLTKENDQ